MEKGQSQYSNLLSWSPRNVSHGKRLRMNGGILVSHVSHVERLAMDGQQSECKTLPEELVQKIVTMMPYPQIFRVRTLSKSWRSKLSPISSIDDEEEKYRAILFQKQVCQRSHRWGTFAPVSFGNILGMDYDLASRNGRNCLPSLSFLPPELSTHLQDLEGPLLCGYSWLQKPNAASGFYISAEFTLFVANILTRTWKQLPPLPKRKDVIFWKKLVRDGSLLTYKVIVLTANFPIAQGCSLLIYDSKTNIWKSQDFREPTNLVTFRNPPAHLNGVLYVPNPKVDFIQAFHVEEETWEKITLTASVDPAARSLSHVRLAVCNGRLLRIDFVRNVPEFPRSNFHYGRVMEIDLASRRVVMIDNYSQYRFKSPRTVNIRDVSLSPFTDGNTLFVGSVDQLGIYDVKEDQWKWLDFQRMDLARLRRMEATPESSAFSFQPGLNPFAEV